MGLHKELFVWKKAMHLAKDVYRMTAECPALDSYGLTDQMRKSALSLMSSIAEGAAWNSDRDFVQHLYVALSSVKELEAQYTLSRELDLTEGSAAIEGSIDEVERMIMGMIKRMKTSANMAGRQAS